MEKETETEGRIYIGSGKAVVQRDENMKKQALGPFDFPDADPRALNFRSEAFRDLGPTLSFG